jgi:hypothetical protein
LSVALTHRKSNQNLEYQRKYAYRFPKKAYIRYFYLPSLYIKAGNKDIALCLNGYSEDA